MNNGFTPYKATFLCLLALFGIIASASSASEPLRHDTAPVLTETFENQVRRAEEVTQSDTPNRDEAARLFFDLVFQQVEILPAYRERYETLVTGLLDISGPQDPAEFWSALSATESPDDIQKALAWMIALFESLYRNDKWTPAGQLDVITETDNVHLNYRSDGGDVSQIIPIPDALHAISPLFSKLWDRRDFGHPLLAGIDTNKIIVRQAIWDDTHETLLFTLQPVTDEPVLTTIVIENLYTNLMAILLQDDQFRAAIDEHAQVAGKDTRNLDPGQVEIQVTLEGVTRFTLKPMD